MCNFYHTIRNHCQLHALSPILYFNEQFKNNLVSVGIESSYFIYLARTQYREIIWEKVLLTGHVVTVKSLI